MVSTVMRKIMQGVLHACHSVEIPEKAVFFFLSVA
jgi:hypothetical protein